MANGVYGIKRGSDVDLSDVEVFLHFSPNRNSKGDTLMTKLTTADVLSKNINPNNTNSVEIFGGLYTLKLPAANFGSKGIYTIVIKPIEIRTTVADVSVLSSQPNIRGLVFETAKIDNKFISKFLIYVLIGYRVEYLNTDKNVGDVKINNVFRIITSNNKAEAVNQNLTNSAQKALRYRFNDSGSFIFATVTPNSPNSAKPNVNPFIGEPGQSVILTNTFFDPIMLEIEMVEYDVEDIAIGLFGNQSKALESGVYSIYNFKNEIYKQYNLYEIMDQFTGKPLFEIRELRSNIDFSLGFNNITTI